MTTHKSYSLFMTSFSIPSIALSNSASEALAQTSLSRIRTAMNYYQDEWYVTRDEMNAYIQKVVDQLHLIVDGESSLREVAQEAEGTSALA